MHELAIAQSIIAAAKECSDGKRVVAIRTNIGELTCVSVEALRFCLPMVAEGSCAERARFEFVQIEGRARCGQCATEFPMTAIYDRCPCGSDRVTITAGEELTVTELELEEAV